MSDRSEQAVSAVQDEVAEVVGRARAAARAIEHYTQEQVDELVTAMAWAVVRKDHAEALAKLAVDEGGFGNYPDKVAKINKRVTGVLADMTGMRTVGVVEENPAAGLVKIAKPVGVVAALSRPPARTPRRRSRRCSRSRAATRSSARRTRGPRAPPRPWSGTCGPRASRSARQRTWCSRCPGRRWPRRRS
jgi:sulfoacetaldehyde dehydrogenase